MKITPKIVGRDKNHLKFVWQQENKEKIASIKTKKIAFCSNGISIKLSDDHNRKLLNLKTKVRSVKLPQKTVQQPVLLEEIIKNKLANVNED